MTFYILTSPHVQKIWNTERPVYESWAKAWCWEGGGYSIPMDNPRQIPTPLQINIIIQVKNLHVSYYHRIQPCHLASSFPMDCHFQLVYLEISDLPLSNQTHSIKLHCINEAITGQIKEWIQTKNRTQRKSIFLYNVDWIQIKHYILSPGAQIWRTTTG